MARRSSAAADDAAELVLLCQLLLFFFFLLSFNSDFVDGERNTPPLQFSPNSTFKIALFADLHYGEAAWLDWGPQQDINSTRVMSNVLDKEAPDFVIYLGDVITANNIPIHNASSYWEMAISPTRTRGIPWATIFGNHDDAPFEWPPKWFSTSGIPNVQCPSYHSENCCSFKGTHRLELVKAEMNMDYVLSHSVSGPKELWPGVSNYHLQISSSGDAASPAAFLYFLDSGGGSYPEVISAAQSAWFQRQSQEINPNGVIPEIVFWHIPSTAYVKIAPPPSSPIRKQCVGSINLENVAPQEAEWGIMQALLSRPSVKAVFVGHNHGLDWCCPYQSLWLCFARHTGYGGYGTWPKGARILEMHEDDPAFVLKSWVRMEDGTQHSEIILASCC